MVEPIKPEEVAAEKVKTIPSEVIECFNKFIARNWNGSSSCFKQCDVVDEIVSLIMKNKGNSDPEFASAIRNSLFDSHHLDVEDIYRESGWKVYYDKPGYNETYDATFEFRKK